MHLFEHLVFPALFFILLAWLFQIEYSLFDISILMFFSLLPDLDFVVFSLSKKGREQGFFTELFFYTLSNLPVLSLFLKSSEKRKKLIRSVSHHCRPSHWPFVYSPLFVLFFFRPNLQLFLICLGLYFHFFLDTIHTSLMWLAPFSKVSFGLNLATKKNSCSN